MGSREGRSGAFWTQISPWARRQGSRQGANGPFSPLTLRLQPARAREVVVMDAVQSVDVKIEGSAMVATLGRISGTGGRRERVRRELRCRRSLVRRGRPGRASTADLVLRLCGGIEIRGVRGLAGRGDKISEIVHYYMVPLCDVTRNTGGVASWQYCR